MSLTYGLKTARDLFEKLSRDANLLDEEVTSDCFFNFVVTAYSLADWVQNDPTVNQNAKSDLQRRFRTTECIKICRDLANASKHFQLDPQRNRNPEVLSARSEQGWGLGRFGCGGFGVGEEEISIVIDNGKTIINGLSLVQDVLMAWNDFFSKHDL